MGNMAIFCPACPQIGVNVPPESEWLPEDRYAYCSPDIIHCSQRISPARLLYRPQLVLDGNMKLVHLKMRRPEDDISLFDGGQFNVERQPYKAHLATAPERQEVTYPLFYMYQTHLIIMYSEIEVQQP